MLSDWHAWFVWMWTLERCLGLYWSLTINRGESEGLSVIMHCISALSYSQHAILANDVNWGIYLLGSIHQIVQMV